MRVRLLLNRFIASLGSLNPFVCTMNKTIGLQLISYALVLVGLSCLSYYLDSSIALPTLIAGVGGGALCLVWGLMAVAGSRGKALSLLTLIPVLLVVLSQVVGGWFEGSGAVPGRRASTAVATLLFLVSLGMLMRIAYAGMFGARKDGSADKGTGDAIPKKASRP